MPLTEGKIGVTEGAGKDLDTTIVTTGLGNVHREGIFLGDPETPAARAKVSNTPPASGDFGIAVRPIEPGPSAATLSRPTIGPTSTELLPANPTRRRFVIFNEHATEDLLIKEGGIGASVTSYTHMVPPRTLFYSPWPGFTGLLHAIFSGGATAAVMVTEETS